MKSGFFTFHVSRFTKYFWNSYSDFDPDIFVEAGTDVPVMTVVGTIETEDEHILGIEY